MSVAGILAGNFLSGLVSQFAPNTPAATIGGSNAPAAFATVQQKLMESASGAHSSPTALSSQLTQLGQDLKSGNLSAAEADYSALKLAIAQRHIQTSGNYGDTASGKGRGGALGLSDSLAAAMLAYSSLQQSASNSALSSSLINPASTFSIDA